MNRFWRSAPLLTVVALGIQACGASGPTCAEFMAMDERGKHDAVIEWAREHDPRVDPDNPEQGAGGFALFADYGSLSMYCGQERHADDRLSELSTGN